MYYLGLAFAEKMGNIYIYDMKPSINAPHTTHKLGEVFKEQIKPLLSYKWSESGKCTNPMEIAINYNYAKAQDWFGCRTCHRTLPFCGTDPSAEHRRDIVQMGPEPIWTSENRAVKHPWLEVFIQLNTEVLNGKAFHMVEVENGVGLEGGYEFEFGIPVKGQIHLNNEWQGFNDYKLMELQAGLQFTIHCAWDETYVYPSFEDFNVIDPQIIWQAQIPGHDAQFNQDTFDEMLTRLSNWVRRDFNLDHENGKALELLNPTLRFFVNMFKLTQMRPWQYVSYLYEIAADLPFQLSNIGGTDEL